MLVSWDVGQLRAASLECHKRPIPSKVKAAPPVLDRASSDTFSGDLAPHVQECFHVGSTIPVGTRVADESATGRFINNSR